MDAVREPELSELLRSAPTRRRRSNQREPGRSGPHRSVPGRPARRRRRRPERRTVLSALAVLTGVVLLLGGVLLHAADDRLDDVARLPDVFTPLDEAQRPPVATDGSTTFLLVGTDVRSDVPTTGAGATPAGEFGRSDAVLLFRVPADGSGADVVSVPRDSYVDVPASGSAPGRRDKLNAAYAFGGPTGLVRTVEQLTDVRVDHVAVVDFAGFRDLTDAVGGVEVQVAEPVTVDGLVLVAGANRLDGDQALTYVRDRRSLPAGDLDRVARQQSYLRGMLSAVAQRRVLLDPFRLDDLLDAATRTVSVDDTLSNTDLFLFIVGLRRLDTGNTRFFTAPVAGTGTETIGAQTGASVVYLDAEAGARFWGFFGDGTLAENAAEFTQLAATPR